MSEQKLNVTNVKQAEAKSEAKKPKSTVKKPIAVAKDNKAEVVFAVVNYGFEQQIVDVCNRLGIGGGTFLNAFGMSKYEAEKFFNVVVQHEKNIVMLVVDAKKRNTLFKELYQAVGPATDAQGIIFALPVDDISENLKEQIFDIEQAEE